MNKKENFKDYKEWPFKEAFKVLKKIESYKEKKVINFETAMDHQEYLILELLQKLLRTNMIINTLKEITDTKINQLAFSDDLDALKKVPEDYPYPDKLSQYINIH